MKPIYQHFAESHNIDLKENGIWHRGCFETEDEATAFLEKHKEYSIASWSHSRKGVSPYGEWSISFDVDEYYNRIHQYAANGRD